MTGRSLAGGRYVLSEAPLGVGGMGTVWKAFDTVLHREVAVKELRIPDGLNPEEHEKLRSRAMREARAAAGLDHPAIVTIHDVVDEGGLPWIVMRLLPGRSLDEAIRTDGPLSPRRAAELGVRLLEALTAAHGNGVLHRDVKPQNVMLGGDGRWMLTDFGIASVAGATRTLTGTGIVTGTLGYIAPERLSGREPGAPADLWALGATLYFAVEGRHAYEHDDLPAMIAAVLTRDPEPPKHAGPLATVIAGLMERDPGRRLDAAAARQQLLAIAGGYPTFEAPTVRLGDADKPTERFGGGSTKVLPDGRTRIAQPSERRSLVRSNRVLRALAALMGVLNLTIGAFLALIAYSLWDGMPYWIAGALVGAIAVGAGLGVWLAPRLARWIGLPVAVAGSAVLMGESLVGAGLMADPERPAAVTVLSGLALVSFALWHRLSRAMRQRIVPPELLSPVTPVYRMTGFGGLLLGAAVASIYFWLLETRLVRVASGNYVVTLLAGAGVVVVVGALLAIPAIRSDRTEPVKRWVPAALTPAALVIPVLVGVQTTVHYVDGLDDFDAVPQICSSDALSQARIAQLVENPPELDASSDSSYVRCTWERESDDPVELEITLEKYDDSRAADRRMQSERRYAEDDGATVTDLQLGDDSIARPYESYINSEATLGTTVEIRLDNVVLETQFERAEAHGRPEATVALATELLREIEAQKPQR